LEIVWIQLVSGSLKLRLEKNLILSKPFHKPFQAKVWRRTHVP